MNLPTLITNHPKLSAAGISTLIAFIGYVAVLLTVFQIIIVFYPSSKIQPDGTILRFQPIFQLLTSVCISAVVNIVLFVIYFKKLQKKLLELKQKTKLSSNGLAD